MRDVTITYLTHERFAAHRQIGVQVTQDWHSLARWLTWPSYAENKRAHGAWCAAALPGGVVDEGKGPVHLLAGDVDDCPPGGIARSAEALRNFAGVVVPTFNATRGKPKHRIALLLSRPLHPVEEFPLAWSKMRRELGAAGIVVDKACKNVNRLYFACVTRSPWEWLGAHILTGAPVDVDSMLAAAREDAAAERARRPKPRPVQAKHRDKYIAAAIESARNRVSSAPEGNRHETLLQEAYALARFDDLTENEIADALLVAFVAAAGEARRREGERAIRDAIAARKGAA